MTPILDKNWNQFIAWHICGQKHDMNTIASNTAIFCTSWENYKVLWLNGGDKIGNWMTFHESVRLNVVALVDGA